MTISRRALLAALGGALLPSVLRGQQDVQLPGDAGNLRDPRSAGGSLSPVTSRDNDPTVVGIERRIQCTCGCTLDVYTCRTTDFTCSYSPAMHREVLALLDQGKTPDQVIAAFVAKYGEKVLMAPKPVGFNIAGYVVPGLAILLVGGVMFAILRQRTRALELARADAARKSPPMPAGASRAVAAAPPASEDELARLERELKAFDA